MSRNNNNNPSTKDQGKDDFEDYFLDDSDLLAIDVDADHLCKQSSSANNCSFPSNNTIINTSYDSSTTALIKQQNIYSSLSTATPMTTGTTMDRSSSPSMNTYNSKRFKVEEGPLTNNNRSKNNKDERDTTTTTAAVIPSQQLQLFEQKMTKTLFKHFGYDKFRKGQLDVLYAIIQQRRDCAVFWATGSGKSLCFQLPALHFYYNNNTKNCNAKKMVAVVISPLVSLMQDQCNKLNGMFSPTTVAVYLGSSQRDKSMDHRALIDGEFPLVFLTPEKLCSGNVIDQIERLPLSVIAIDEAHCVSEWGHDFRKEYRQLCIIRNRRMLSDVPILTLTGTATPRVREDIISSLLLKNPLIQIHSNDRDNLRLEVHRKPTNGGFKAALQQSLIRDLNQCRDGAESTIIYAPTIKAVEDISQWLSIQLPKLRIMPYHSKLTEDQREAAHVGFLVGSVSVVVATIAFGMGIDKPDTRRVIHYGPPKTMEEYVQQIGRAGRDGRTAHCIMYADYSDFSKYDSDFYLGQLNAIARANTLNSLGKLQNYAMTDKCRRAELLRYFSEDPPFGEHCGTCDNCTTRRDPSALRNLSKETFLILLAVNALSSQSASVIEKVLSGNIVEPYRYKSDINPTLAKKRIEEARKDQRYPISMLKELIPSLVTCGYLEIGSRTSTNGQHKHSWTTYDTTFKGKKQILDPLSPVQIPLPSGIKMLEEEAEKKRLALLSTLKDSGVKLADIPAKELESGEGEIIKSYQFWITHLENQKKQGKHERVEQLKGLYNLIEHWRSSAANKFKMAPTDVMPEHLISKVAYTSATSKVPMTEEILGAVGVRSGAINELAAALQKWTDDNATSANISANGAVPARSMVFPKGQVFSPSQPWPLARIPKARKTGEMASWESSYTRFMKGEQPQSIAITAMGGKPIQVRTVVGHILDALTFGKPVPLDRLAVATSLPSYEDWTTLQELEASGGPEMDVVKHDVKASDILAPVMGVKFMETPYQERQPEDSLKYSAWCENLKVYMAFRRAGYTPSFD